MCFITTQSTYFSMPPDSTWGMVQAISPTKTTPAAMDQNSLKLARRSPVNAISTAPMAGDMTANKGMIEMKVDTGHHLSLVRSDTSAPDLIRFLAIKSPRPIPASAAAMAITNSARAWPRKFP